MKGLGVLVAAVLCIVPLTAFANLSSIEALITVSDPIVDPGGPHDGWYLYEILVHWENLAYGNSHWDLILKCEAADGAHLVEFDVPAGYSKDNAPYPEPPYSGALPWKGSFDPSGDPQDGSGKPAIKYEYDEQSGEPGTDGYGIFWFYSNIIPEPYDPVAYPDVFLVKIGGPGGGSIIYANLDDGSVYPSCEVIPEPSAIVQLLFGGVLLFHIRRKMK